MGRRHTLPDVELTGDYARDVEQLRTLQRNIKDSYDSDPKPHGLTHRVGPLGSDPLPTPNSPRTVIIASSASASAGVGPSYMREDAQLVLPPGVPVDLGAANAEGNATTAARSNHVHKRTIEVRVNSALVAVRRMLNLIAGTGVTIAGVDDGAGDEVDVTVSVPGLAVRRPAQIAASQNDYDPGGIASVIFLDSSADVDITGIVAQADGTLTTIWNVGNNIITLKHNDAASAIANRFLGQGDADVMLKAGFSATITYDGVVSRWRAREE